MTGDRDLATRFRRLIALHGPMPVARFMGESNARYYASRDPLGAPAADGGLQRGGDFVTAPEISQMFGELVGLWLADIWVRAGQPAGVRYAELGPGRGTLARDALRAMAGAGLHPPVHLVEGSPFLRRLQAQAIPAARFHDDVSGLPDDGPLLLVANEFLDALPVRQLVRTPRGWRERMVGLTGNEESGGFVFIAGDQPMDDAVPEGRRDAPTGTIIETCPAAAATVHDIAAQIARRGGAALFVDYGHLAPRTGSTLQAIKAHRKVDPLAMPGAADLTCHVDFDAVGQVAREAGCRVHTGTQGEWLTALGIELRARALAAAAPSRAGEIAAARKRLVQPGDMGNLFKVLAITAPGWPAGAGLKGEM